MCIKDGPPLSVGEQLRWMEELQVLYALLILYGNYVPMDRTNNITNSHFVRF